MEIAAEWLVIAGAMLTMDTWTAYGKPPSLFRMSLWRLLNSPKVW